MKFGGIEVEQESKESKASKAKQSKARNFVPEKSLAKVMLAMSYQ